MISYRHADLLNKIREHQSIPIDVTFTIHFPTTNGGQEFKKDDEDRYFATFFVDINATDSDSNLIVEKMQRVLRIPGFGEPVNSGSTTYLVSRPGETWDSFNRRIRDEIMEKMRPICVGNISVSGQSAGRYEWILKMKIRNY